MTAEDPSLRAEPDSVPWFYRTDQGKTGPVSLQELRDRIATGAVSVETPVWRYGFGSWLAASACEELRQAVAANRSSVVSRSGARRAAPGVPLVTVLVIAAAIVAWRSAAWLFGIMAVAQVTGTVTSASRPVTGGSVILSPIAEGSHDAPGKPGVATVMPDGRFSLRIVPGNHGLAKRYAVRFSPPVLPPMGEAEAMRAVPPYSGLVPKTGEVAIHSGANTIDIEIVPSLRQ